MHNGDATNVRRVLAGMLLAGACAFALDPALDVSQYAHTSWKYRDGFTKGEIYSVVQTSDGYLWLGTGFGLFRFDGVRPVAWQFPPDQSGKDQKLPSNSIGKLLAARDGTLWIGTRNGLGSWKNGKLTRYSELAGSQILALIEDHEGSIWAGAEGAKLCEIRNESVRCDPEISSLAPAVAGLYEDTRGNLWVGLRTGLWRWKPGPPQFYPVRGELNGIRDMAEGEDGALLVSTIGGVRRLVDGKVTMAYPFSAATRNVSAQRMLRDRDGGLWVGTTGRGIVHTHSGRTDVFSQSDGLTGDIIRSFFEDREANIWVATVDGLDRFRELPVVTYSTNQGLSSNAVLAVLGAKDGGIWFTTFDGLHRLKDGRVTIYRARGTSAKAGADEISVGGMPDRGIGTLFEDSRGRVWVSVIAGLGYLENDRYVPTAAPAGNVGAFAEDASGDLWIASEDLGLLRRSAGEEIQRTPWTAMGHEDDADDLVRDPVKDGVWLGFLKGGIAYFRKGQVRASYSIAEGLAQGRVNQLRFDGEGGLWIAAEGGLSRLKDGRIATLTAKNGLPCDAVQWTMEDDADSVWLGMTCGLARVARAELDAWAADPKRAIHPTVFDLSDGVRPWATAAGNQPHVAKSLDGRLWFGTAGGLSVVDPRHLASNQLPPPVQIEQITADRKTYWNNLPGDTTSRWGRSLPPKTRDLQIDYTALSFADPEKIRFRYKLEGHDTDWQDAGNRRQAFYNDLPPRRYRFRVMASNNNGVWNEAGASFDFSVAPAYYQTGWFRLSFLGAFFAVLWGIYYLRVQYLAHQFSMRMDERVNERMRIARDLHDTLLQSFQGVLLKFHAVSFMLSDRPEARTRLDGAIEQARNAIAEGRDAVQGLRLASLLTNDLAKTINTFAEGLAVDQPHPPGISVQVEGEPRDLVPLVRDEVYRIAVEGLRNAFNHARAARIEVEIHYGERWLRLRVRDNGKGIHQTVLKEGGREGHHGLPGMHERAKGVGGKLAVWSQPDSGTEIELTIPGGIAFAKSSAVREPAAVGEERD